MHPLLNQPKKLLYVILIWLPIIVSFISLESTISGTPWLHSALLFGPMLFLELFILLSTWYVCRTIPLEAGKILNFIFKHGGTALVMNAIWLQITMMYSETLVLINVSEVWREYFNRAFPLLLATGVLFYFLACLFHYLLITLENSRQAEQEAIENHLLASRAELESLKSTIHPHFLFNSLTALSTLTMTSAEKANKMCIQLSDFLRYSLQYGKNEFVTVQDELNHINNYLGVEQVRLGNRLKLKFNISDETLKIKILPFALLPLIENAVKHGIQEKVLGGTISIDVQVDHDLLRIVVRNPFEQKSAKSKSEGHGLKTLQQRLDAIYKGKANIFTSTQNSKFSVTINLPMDMEN
ncbi:MAG: histidine kinase [Calditrichaceae bacterium]|jgi:two-component system, LytTR family, sensor kinase